ncbi:nickel-type superoxide dismutase maturation protease [Kitasatospora sp. NPDC054939]
MVPTLRDGDRLLVRYGAPVRPGAVAVFRHPLRQDLLVVKRVAGRRPTGWWMLSDNRPIDSDSRQYGAVPDELVVGRALLRLAPRPVWLAPGRRLERLLLAGRPVRVPGLARRLGVWADPDRL